MQTMVENSPGALVNADDLPVYKIDPMFDEGALIILEPARTFAAGVPASGSPVRNLAAENVVRLGYDPAMVWLMDAEANDGVHGIIERTATGAIHSIVSVNSPMAAGKGAAIPFPLWAVAHVANNPTHRYGWSVWMNITRKRAGQYAQTLSVMTSNGAMSAGIAAAPYIGIQAAHSTGAQRMLKEAIPSNPVNDANSQQELWREALAFGRRARGNETIDLASVAGYRLVLKDLTLSGQTYAEFAAQDAELFAEAFGPGGRYAGDTFTAPTALP